MLRDFAGITAAILSGGLGTRLRSVVDDRPKVLAEVQGRPFLSFLLDQLVAAGLRTVVLCTGYLGKQIQTKFGASYGSLNLVYSQEPSPLGTAGALRLALPLLKSDSVLAMNGDSFCDTALNDFWDLYDERRVAAALLLTHVADTKHYGRVYVDAAGRVLKFDEKDGSGGPGWINAGIYLLKHRLLETIPANSAVSLEREMFPAWIEQGLYGCQGNGRFIDIGVPEAYAAAEHFFSGSDTIR
jgi:D-glycero-alpha-D-manno-heptose 1-phosphate guanylyltransferase